MPSVNSVVIGRERCPKCARNGKDRSGDNLAIYSDGHEFCFACQYFVDAPIEEKLKQFNPEENMKKTGLFLPFDCSVNFPEDVLSRLSSWGISEKDIKDHSFLWSNSRKVLVMPVYGINNELLMYQERSWDLGQRKYLTYGQKSDILHILTPPNDPNCRDVIILTEDLISAIRVSKYKPAMPVWGSDIALKTIRRLASQFNVVGVWLDPDMKLKAVKDVLRISQYVPAFFIGSSLDPKFYQLDRIKEHIDIAGYKMIYKDQPAIISDKTETQELLEESHKRVATYPIGCVMDTHMACGGRNGHRCCQD